MNENHNLSESGASHTAANRVDEDTCRREYLDAVSRRSPWRDATVTEEFYAMQRIFIERMSAEDLAKLRDFSVEAEFGTAGLASLYENVVSYLHATSPTGRMPSASRLATFHTMLSRSITRKQVGYKGRYIKSWFASNGSPMSAEHYEDAVLRIQANEQLKRDFRKLCRVWPEGVKYVYNTSVPRLLGMFYDPRNPIQTHSPTSPTNRGNKAFRDQALRFLHKWNLLCCSKSTRGYDCLPCPIWAASDPHGQGTLIFVPRLFSYNVLRNKQHEVSSLQDLIDNVYVTRSRRGAKPFAVKLKPFYKFLESSIGTLKPTRELIAQFTEAWCDQKVNSAPRLATPTRRDAYFEAGLKWYGIRAPAK